MVHSVSECSERDKGRSQGWIKGAELKLAKKFEERTGIHVDYQIIPADEYFSVLKTKLNSGEATDIFGGQSSKTDLQVQYDVEKNAEVPIHPRQVLLRPELRVRGSTGSACAEVPSLGAIT